MGAGHGGLATGLYVERVSPVHALRPQCKVVALFLFVVMVVVTPREAMWAFAGYALLLVALGGLARIPLAFVARRMLIEVPFLAFAFFMPLVGTGPRTEVLGLSLSVQGLWGAWNILAKGTLGVAAAALLAATTRVPDLLHGLERLRLPRALTSTAGFMVRYADVIAEESRRMRVARASRGYDPRWLWQARAVATGAGTLFVRSYERGERVYLAMLSRGYTGALPDLSGGAAPPRHWGAALALPALAAVVAVTALVRS